MREAARSSRMLRRAKPRTDQHRDAGALASVTGHEARQKDADQGDQEGRSARYARSVAGGMRALHPTSAHARFTARAVNRCAPGGRGGSWSAVGWRCRYVGAGEQPGPSRCAPEAGHCRGRGDASLDPRQSVPVGRFPASAFGGGHCPGLESRAGAGHQEPRHLSCATPRCHCEHPAGRGRSRLAGMAGCRTGAPACHRHHHRHAQPPDLCRGLRSPV